ncbi:Rubrerythrin [Malonomonas rubra DSM 5091]|uniref:Rubrerythrin n=1 Tax=Malonomonas rubra DSM 5091 TaxID=1122189 RepID=A0A1M6HDA4_MALRU|nr:ferritin family protein [Malonomonas rubra]SHJ20141.1 Rubrerythrin [Malonomonas rubra DSM 5091]
MPQEMKHQEALKIAVETEKGLICFYRRAAELVADDGAKQFFSRLAKEKEEQAGKLFRFYKGTEYGSLDEYINSSCTFNAEAMKELNGLEDVSVKERRAREIAMAKEQNLEKTLRSKAKNIIDPGVREIFEQMAKASQHHYEIVESEYARMMRMPHETDINTFVRE